jgi:hypothetical protein
MSNTQWWPMRSAASARSSTRHRCCSSRRAISVCAGGQSASSGKGLERQRSVAADSAVAVGCPSPTARRGDFLEGFALRDAPEFEHWPHGGRRGWPAPRSSCSSALTLPNGCCGASPGAMPSRRYASPADSGSCSLTGMCRWLLSLLLPGSMSLGRVFVETSRARFWGLPGVPPWGRPHPTNLAGVWGRPLPGQPRLHAPERSICVRAEDLSTSADAPIAGGVGLDPASFWRGVIVRSSPATTDADRRIGRAWADGGPTQTPVPDASRHMCRARERSPSANGDWWVKRGRWDSCRGGRLGLEGMWPIRWV